MPITKRQAAMIAAAFATAPAFAQCQPGPTRIDLPAQRLDERLQALAHRTGCFVDVDSAAVAGKRAPALKGNLTTDAAFFGSVKGTGLEAGPTQGRWRIDRGQQTAFAARIAELHSRIDAGRKAGHIATAQAGVLVIQIDSVNAGVVRLVRRQGFLSAAERSSYTVILDGVAAKLA